MIKNTEYSQDDRTVLLDRQGHGPASSPMTDFAAPPRFEQLEKRMPFRRIVKNALEQIMDAGALGAKIAVSGRLGGAEIARTEWLYRGKLPLHTLRANIDFARATAFTTYGTIGVKVWINKGEVFENSGKLVSGKQ